MNSYPVITCIDLFCGTGGLTHGFIQENLQVVAGIDSDSSCRYAYEHNNGAKFINKMIEDVEGEDILALYPKGSLKVLVGCAPCQPFSTYSRRKATPPVEGGMSMTATDGKWRLLTSFADLIERVEPTIVSMENVPALQTFKAGAVYKDFVARLEKTYYVTCHIVSCPDYGIPQTRRRLVLFASKFGKVDLVPPTHSKGEYRTVSQAIKHLPPIAAGEKHVDDPLHWASCLSPLNLQRIQLSKSGGTWRDWNKELRAGCHVKLTGSTYPSVYGRMSWDDPSPTITTQFQGYGNGRFGHPEQDRAISLREAALLQTFPATYVFADPGTKWSITTIARHIGNAVPVSLGRVIAQSIKQHVKAHDD